MMNRMTRVLIGCAEAGPKPLIKALSAERPGHVVEQVMSASRLPGVAQAFKPDVIVLTDTSWLDAAGQFSAPLLVISNDDAEAIRAISGGALGVVRRVDSTVDFLKAIRALSQGEAFIDPQTTTHLVDFFQSTASPR